MPSRFSTTTQTILIGTPALLLAMGCSDAGVTATEPDPISGVEVVAEARPAWVTLPMRMTFTVEVQGPVPDPLPECAVAHLASALEGTASYLGQFRGIGSTCIRSLVPDPDPPFPPPGPAPWATASFSNPLWVLTAANGDELWLRASDATAVLGIDPNDGSFTSLASRGTHVIIGGTGRFADANGELRTIAVNEDGQGPDDVYSEGWIRY
jgi:hypothetical protein